jgi:hypothetical protein
MALANTAPSIGHITSFGVWQYGQVTPSGTSLIVPWPTASNCLLQVVQRTLFSMATLQRNFIITGAAATFNFRIVDRGFGSVNA